MMLLMPMAGEGKRFRDAGYTTPKPFIEIDGKPMFLRAMHDLPVYERNIFISSLKIPGELMPAGSENILVQRTTAGQASTCLLAKSYTDNDEPLLISACDNGLQFDHALFDRLTQEADCIVFTFRHHPHVLPHPEQYGWVKTDGDTATAISCKKPVSNDPLNDHAITGAFWFAKGKYFNRAAEKMIAENRRINHEFYVDECINDVIAEGLNVKVLEVQKYIGWGTPNDLNTYLYWQQYFTHGNA